VSQLLLGGAAGGRGDGGAAGLATEAISFCSRLGTPEVLAGVVAIDFDFASAEDCRVAGIPFLYVLENSNERAAFLNGLEVFNYALWGCTSVPPSHFALVYQAGLLEDPRPITSADVDALIEDYLLVATPRLGLSKAEIRSLDSSLHALAEEVVGETSSEYSRSNCDGAGGAGGSAGAGGSTGGGAGGEGGA
jgi:uncharacterized membrane protein YgcG